jgi:hypothetical protein
MKLLILTMLVFMIGCNGGESEAKKGGQVQDARQESVFDPMIQTIDRAKGVEELSMNRKEDLDRQIEESE